MPAMIRLRMRAAGASCALRVPAAACVSALAGPLADPVADPLADPVAVPVGIPFAVPAAVLVAFLVGGPAAGLVPSVARGQTVEAVERVLDRPVDDFRVASQDAKTVLEGLGSAYRFPVVVEPEVQGTVSFEVHHATLRTVLDAVCRPKGWSCEVVPAGYLLVARFVTRVYPVDYLQMTRNGSSAASVNLSQSGTTAGGAFAGAGGAPGGTVAAAAQGGAGGGAGGIVAGAAASSAGSSSLSLSEQNDSDFWGRLESDLKAMLAPGETLIVNRFAGLVQLRGSLITHGAFDTYLGRLLERVGRQARISVKIVEVDLNDQSKTGVDWSVAGAALGRIAGSPLSAGLTTTTGPVAQAGPLTLSSDTFAGTIGAGRVQAVVSALAEQGNVRIESKPEISALNNQTAFIQVSQDEPFFSRTNVTTLNAGGGATTGVQPVVTTNYSESTVSFGNLLEITVQIADDLSTTLSLSPAVTELKGTVTSPDGQETAPITGTKRARTTITLANHETAVIGGFITETKATDRRGIPLLSSVPVIGRAFDTNSTAKNRTELIFLVTVNAERGPGGGRVADRRAVSATARFPDAPEVTRSGNLGELPGGPALPRLPAGPGLPTVPNVQRVDVGEF